MSAHDDSVPQDELTRRYREANAQDMRRPGTHVRQRVQQHARAVLESTHDGAPTVQKTREAANQPRWKISMLASIALIGLTGLLVLQFDRGTPEERALVYGQPGSEAPPAATAPPPQQALPVTPRARPAPPAATERATEKAPPAKAPALSGQMPASAGAALPSPASPPPAAGARSSSTPSSALSDGGPAGKSGSETAAPETPVRAAPVMRAPAPPQNSEFMSRQPPAVRAEAGSPPAAAQTLFEAARAGRVPQLESLLRQGASINAPDAAGRTPLMLAAMHGHAAMVQRLLALGANPAQTDRDGLSAAQHARRQGFEQIAALIEAGA